MSNQPRLRAFEYPQKGYTLGHELALAALHTTQLIGTIIIIMNLPSWFPRHWGPIEGNAWTPFLFALLVNAMMTLIIRRNMTVKSTVVYMLKSVIMTGSVALPMFFASMFAGYALFVSIFLAFVVQFVWWRRFARLTDDGVRIKKILAEKRFYDKR